MRWSGRWSTVGAAVADDTHSPGSEEMPDVPGMILVVAPDTAFRLSLRFMLEAEGFDVVVPSSFEDARLLRRKANCMIVDHDTLAAAESVH